MWIYVVKKGAYMFSREKKESMCQKIVNITGCMSWGFTESYKKCKFVSYIYSPSNENYTAVNITMKIDAYFPFTQTVMDTIRYKISHAIKNAKDVAGKNVTQEQKAIQAIQTFSVGASNYQIL